jgi:hypothetical protein
MVDRRKWACRQLDREFRKLISLPEQTDAAGPLPAANGSRKDRQQRLKRRRKTAGTKPLIPTSHYRDGQRRPPRPVGVLVAPKERRIGYGVAVNRFGGPQCCERIDAKSMKVDLSAC